MSQFKLIVTFQGNCSFAPKKDGSELSVFLPLRNPIKHPKVPIHHAAISGDFKYLTKPVMGYIPPGEWAWFFDRQDLEIVPDLGFADANLEIAGFKDLGTAKEPSLVRKPKKDETGVSGEYGFWWLAPLEKACLARQLAPGGGTLEPTFTKSPMDEEDADILQARFNKVNRGKVYISDFLLDPQSEEFVVWRFRNFSGHPDNRDHLQILAGKVVLVQKINGDHVKLVAKSLDDHTDPNRSGYVTLYPHDGEVRLVVLNEESDMFMREIPPGELSMKKPRERDRIFETFYGLARNPPPPDEMPMPVADYPLGEVLADAAGEPAQSAPPCSPSRLEAFS